MNDIDIKNSLDRLLERHRKAVLLFSGGKDSLCVLDLCKDYLDRILVLHLDTGAKLPHMQGFAEEAVKRLGGNIKVVQPEISPTDCFKEFGFPVNIVPIRRTGFYKDFYKNPVKVQSLFDCCTRLRWLPMANFLERHGATLLINGHRKKDLTLTKQNGFIGNGFEWFVPIDNWTTEEVMDYLHQNNVPMPPDYPLGAKDCWHCTAIEPDAEGVNGLIFLKDKYPERHKALVACLKAVHGLVNNEVERFEKMLNEIV